MNESRCVTPIIGQEAICPDGLGRVVAYNFDNPYDFIQVQTYINDRSCKWDAKNVQLIDPFSGNKPKVASDPETERSACARVLTGEAAPGHVVRYSNVHR